MFSIFIFILGKYLHIVLCVFTTMVFIYSFSISLVL